MKIGDRVRYRFHDKPTGTVLRLFPENPYNLLVELDEEFYDLVPSGDPPMQNWAEKDVEAIDES